VPVETLVKQPAESRLFSMDFSPLMATGETISAVSSCTALPTGLTISGAATSGQVATARIAAGTAGTKYKVTFVVTTSAGNTLEAEGVLQVRNL
jgi:hypothetical protein